MIRRQKSLSIAITGSGGSGVVTAGSILLEAMALAGYYGLMSRSAGPQIRGGESAVMLRFGDQEVNTPGDFFDVLLAIDWGKFARFADEIPLDGDSIVLNDSSQNQLPEVVSRQGVRSIEVPLKETTGELKGGRPNMVGLGVLASMHGLSSKIMAAAIERVLGHKGERIIETSLSCLERGMALADTSAPLLTEGWLSCNETRWSLTGNEACGLGALRAGVRFVAAYPITPASDMLEWLSPRLEHLGGVLLQAEDELAAINMTIGASFGGVPALTATSGPGLSLMVEGIGLAIASETPLVVVDVMRGGPSTGIPTKSEQADLNLALYGVHGDAPHMVLAPLDIKDCVFTTQWAVCLAERLQSVAIVLSDQSLGQTRAILNTPEFTSMSCRRKTTELKVDNYLRYQLTPDGVSPMTVPGITGGMYTADGLEHGERGTPSSMAEDHTKQLTKRRSKLQNFEYGKQWSEIEGEGEIALITWGSCTGVVREAAQRLQKLGYSTRTIAVRLIAPLQVKALNQTLTGCERVFIVEQNSGRQFYHYLKAQDAIPPGSLSFARPGPLPIRPGELVSFISTEITNG
ncbi:MAG: 2-oxoacid:acceptor oxidoreductase subunit alpha [Gammaproteobacteria bacterium]|nr:MAG: 2-oxoacid:acceptor oxidoreductase subunit alpha [Gammaproteobacteria bacterium]